MTHFTISNFPVAHKTVLLRVDYNVPLSKGKITDPRRILASLPTLKFLLQQNCKIVLATHLGRPEGKIMPSLCTKVLVPTLQKYLPKQKILALKDCIGKEIHKKISEGLPKEIFLLENLRFYQEEEENNAFFAHSLASLAEVYVNDAFAVSHRKHASVHAITRYLPSVAGFLLEKEITDLSKAMHPQRPAVWIMGGAKLNKIELMKQAFRKADYILVGGALAFSFLKAQGYSVGMSKIDRGSVKIARRILKEKVSRKIILPKDFVVADAFSPRAKTHLVTAENIQSHQMGLDLGPETVAVFKQYLSQAKIVFWNGPLGYFEWAKFATATKMIGRFIGTRDIVSLAGGGETAEALEKFHLDHYFTHVSTGGGAALEFLSGNELPGIRALEENWRKWRRKVRL